MKWMLVVISVTQSTGWGQASHEFKYPMPDKEVCLEAVKSAKVNSIAESKTSVVVACVQE